MSGLCVPPAPESRYEYDTCYVLRHSYDLYYDPYYGSTTEYNIETIDQNEQSCGVHDLFWYNCSVLLLVFGGGY